MKELTEEEAIYYADYALIDTCDCCGDWFPIHNGHDGEDFLEYDGFQFLCRKCRS
jgi:hypothetical protein